MNIASSADSLLQNPFRSVGAAFRQYLNRPRDIAAAAALDDHVLRDIGLSRTDLNACLADACPG
jgi:uncharacterized protein YjiS (DUF1127 family)